MNEISRQLVHLSGVLFVILAQFMESLVASATFFLIALTFLLYSLYIRNEEKLLERFIGTFEKKVRKIAYRFERQGIPFQGAFWFYFSCGISFLIFPHTIATAATLILSVSDSLATLVGKHFGRTRLLEDKTLEGTLVFLLSSLVISYHFFPSGFLLGAIAATLGEVVPGFFPRLREKGILDDNLLIPLFAGAIFLLGT